MQSRYSIRAIFPAQNQANEHTNKTTALPMVNRMKNLRMLKL